MFEVIMTSHKEGFLSIPKYSLIWYYYGNAKISLSAGGGAGPGGVSGWADLPHAQVLNVDGYLFTFESNRNWRKNRADNGAAC